VAAVGQRFVRIHRRAHAPWWHCRDGSGRFDLVGHGELGTCYLAEDELASFVEVFRDFNPIPRHLIEERAISSLILGRDIRLADCTSRQSRRFGVTAAIHSGTDYGLTQKWAAAFAQDQFGGIRYFISHDPSQRLVGIALFGRSNSESGSMRPIPEEVLLAAEREFGLRTLPVDAA
jgi:hypothetical protein